MNNFTNQNWKNPQTNQQNSQNNQQTNQQPNNQSAQQPPSMIMKLVGSCLPVILENFMGQQMPPSNSNNPETQLILSQVLSIQQQILTNQQALNQRLLNLEQNAAQQFTNLVQQVQSIKSVRLTHDRERKQIDYNLHSENEEQN